MSKGILAPICIGTIVLLAACSDDVVPPADGPGAEAYVDIRVDLSQKEAGPKPDADGGAPDQDMKVDKCVLKMKINGVTAKDAVAYSSLDDKDTTTAGIQVDVEVEVTGTAADKSVDLEVTGQTKATKTSSSGKASFTGVTLAAASAPITIEAKATSCTGVKAAKLTVVESPSCTFVTPDKNTGTLYSKDNEGDATTFKYTFKITTKNALKGQVELTVGGASAQPSSTAKPDSVGVAIFKATHLKQNVTNDVKATVSVTVGGKKLTATCTPAKNPIYVDTSIPKCDCCGFSPSPKAIAVTPKWGLGKLQDSDNNPANGVQTTVSVTTDSKKVDSVTLDLGDGSAPITKKVTADKVTFPVTIKEGLHSMKASCENTTTKAKGKGTWQILVDITKPKAVTDLDCAAKGKQNREGKATCTWTAAMDPGTSPSGIAKYDLRMVKGAKMTTTTWTGATPTLVPAAPKTNTKILDKLQMPNSYYFGIAPQDHLGNVGPTYFPAKGAKIDFNVQEIKGPAPGGNFGSTIALGDFNCDGLTDMAVGISTANAKKGEVQIFFGTGSGYPKVASKKISGTLAAQNFGLRLAALNFDKDANNCSDLAVGAELADNKRGRVYLYLGRQVWKDRDDVSTGKGAEIIYHVDTTKAGTDQLGGMVAGLDLDGDGAGDLAMVYWDKAKGWSNVLVDYGEARGLTPMQAGQARAKRQMPDKADVKIIGGKSAAFFGAPTVRGGLLTAGDKAEELLIGAAFEKDTSGNKGAVYVILGKAATTGVETIDVTKTSTRVIKIVGSTTSALFGASLAGVGDINGDKTAEFLVGDMGFNSYAGAGYVFNLATTPKSLSDAKATLTNDNTTTTYNMFCRSIAAGVEVDAAKGADVNNDGNADMICGMMNTGAKAAGSAQVFFGKAGTIGNFSVSKADLVLQPKIATTAFSSSNAFIADVNGDKYPDIVVTDYAFSNKRGRAMIYY